MINFQEVTLQIEQKVLFENVSFTFYDNQKIGLVGANGSGKTSLLKLLLGELEASTGKISYQGNLRFAHLRQEVNDAKNCTAIEYVMQGDAWLYALSKKIAVAEQNKSFEKLAKLHLEFSELNGYMLKPRAAELLAGLGFDAASQQKLYQEFSGGWRVRLNLAKALMAPSDVLLLDEPTNHLDLDALLWLESWLQNYVGLLIIISHDREFLDKTVNRIAHIENKAIKFYIGNYSTFEEERAKQLALQQKIYEKQQRQIAHMMKFVERFRYKASKAKQAQSRLKAIERIDRVAAIQANSPFQFEFFKPEKLPYPLITLNDLCVNYEEKSVLKNVNWQLVPEDRVTLLGANGAGKSTLIKAIIGEILPRSGTIITDGGVKIGYFAQHQLESLTLSKNALEQMQELLPNMSTQELRNYLGGFGFSGEDIFKPVEKFSGGEKSRLALAIIVSKRPNVLLLDEPTNHLDIEMRMALTLALQKYQGAMVLISHDRHLIRTTVDTLYYLHEGKLNKFVGNLDDYQQMVKQLKAADASDKVKAESQTKEKKRTANPMKIAKIEEKIAEIEKRLTEINMELSSAAIYTDQNKEKLKNIYKEQSELQANLKLLEKEWLERQIS